MKKIIMIV